MRDKKQLSIMSCEYNRCIKRLKQLVAKCERILLFLEACRKYETEDEKVLPFIASSIPVEISASKDASFIPVRDHIWQVSKLSYKRQPQLRHLLRQTMTLSGTMDLYLQQTILMPTNPRSLKEISLMQKKKKFYNSVNSKSVLLQSGKLGRVLECNF